MPEPTVGGNRPPLSHGAAHGGDAGGYIDVLRR
jgi:hypothetical protein